MSNYVCTSGGMCPALFDTGRLIETDETVIWNGRQGRGWARGSNYGFFLDRKGSEWVFSSIEKMLLSVGVSGYVLVWNLLF